MRIATYNIQYWTGMDRVQDPERTLAVVREINPDVIALQEVVHPLTTDEKTSPLARLAAELGAEYRFAEIWPAGTLKHIAQPLGLALLSRYPILAHASHKLPSRPPDPPRRLLEARLLLPDDRYLTVYTTHLEWRWEDVRHEQVKALLLWTTRDRGKPHVLLGDFNSVHPADIARVEAEGVKWEDFVRQVQEEFPQAPLTPKTIPSLLKAGYVDAFQAVGTGDGRTYTTAAPTLRLDYCFLDASLQPVLRHAQRWTSEGARVASDHYPVVVDLDLPTP